MFTGKNELVCSVVFLVGMSLASFGLTGKSSQKRSAKAIDPPAEYSVFSGTMADLTWPEIEKAVQHGALVLVPLGVIEEHGPHIACAADLYQAYLHCREVKNQLDRDGVRSIIAPPVYWGINTSTRNFPGSFDMRPDTMKALLTDILSNLKRWGFSEVYYLNLHGEGGQNQIIIESAWESRQNPGIKAHAVLSDRMARRYGLTGSEEHVVCVAYEPPPGEPRVAGPDFHAGAGETGDMVAFFPRLVDIELARTLKAPEVNEGRYREWGQNARKVTPLGYAGDPSSHDAEWSRKAVLSFCSATARAIAKKRGTS